MTIDASTRLAAIPTQLIDDAETGWHRHEHAYVVVPETDCSFLLEEPGGERRVETPAGAAYRRDAGVEHNVVNGGAVPMSFVEIEIKTARLSEG